MIDWNRARSRREVFQRASELGVRAAAAGTIAFFLGPVAHTYLRDRYTKEHSEKETKQASERIRKRHGVAIHIDTPKTLPSGGEPVTVTPEDSSYLQMCAALEFEKLLNIYPPDTIGRFIESVAIGDFPTNSRAGGLLADDGKTLAIRLNSLFGSHASLFGTLINAYSSHHEIGHSLTKEHIFVREVSADFAKLNPRLAYLGVFLERFYPGEKIDDLEPGFVRAFGRKSVHEDIAEIIALLFRGNSAVEKRLLHEDTVLAPSGEWRGVLKRKIDEVKKIIKAKIPHMDEQFWNDVQTPKMRDPIAYWNDRGVFQQKS